MTSCHGETSPLSALSSEGEGLGEASTALDLCNSARSLVEKDLERAARVLEDADKERRPD